MPTTAITATAQPLQPFARARPASSGDIASIQYLRGIAAILVVFAHANEQFMGAQQRILRDVGWSGVDLFFIISGFVMTYTAAKHTYARWGFLRRRLVRICPMYWLMTIVTAAIALAAPALLQTTRFSWDALLCSFLFLPIASAPLLHLGWTLDYEMFFYVVFALCLGFAPWRRTGVLALAFGGLILLVGQLHPKPAMLDFYANSITFEFLFGCLIGCAYLDGWLRRIPLAASIALLILGVGALAFGGINDDGLSNRAVLRGLPAFVIVLSLLSIEQHVSLQSRPLHRIGDATYSIYLTHIFVVAGLRKAWNLAHLPTGGLAIYVYVALCVSIATGVGVVAFNSVERRLTSIGKRVARV